MIRVYAALLERQQGAMRHMISSVSVFSASSRSCPSARERRQAERRPDADDDMRPVQPFQLVEKVLIECAADPDGCERVSQFGSQVTHPGFAFDQVADLERVPSGVITSTSPFMRTITSPDGFQVRVEAVNKKEIQTTPEPAHDRTIFPIFLPPGARGWCC